MEILLFPHLFRDVAARKTDIMRLELSGRFAINVVNNLIVVHHQASRVINFIIKSQLLFFVMI